MAFQRSYSKVWWGNDNQHTAGGMMMSSGSSLTSGGFYYSLYNPQQQYQQQQQLQLQHQASEQLQQQQGFHSLDYNSGKSGIGNLSRILEVEDENNVSKLMLWEKHDSPGSLRSQDSGFSDNDESHSTRSLGGRSSKTASPSAKSDISARSSTTNSPSSASTHTIATPPTVIRRVGKSQFYSPLVNITRRISFSGSPAKQKAKEPTNETARVTAVDDDGGLDMMQQLNSTPLKQLEYFDDNEDADDDAELNKNDLSRSGSSRLHGKPKDQDVLTTSHNESTSSTNTTTTTTTSSYTGNKQLRRRRRVVRKATIPLTPARRRVRLTDRDSAESNDDDDEEAEDDSNYWHSDELHAAAESNESTTTENQSAVPEYNNETVYLGEAPPPYNNETVVFGTGATMDATLTHTDNDALHSLSPIKAQAQTRFTASTSTPKAKKSTKAAVPSVAYAEYENPLLNGHPPALQSWLQDIRQSYDQEVMSTLQTKSIAQEAFKNLTITTNTVAKLIRQLQQRALFMQSDFERVERILSGQQAATLNEALASAHQLLNNVSEFTKVLERRAVFFSDTRAARKKYDDNIEQIRIVTKDTRYSLERQHYISLESLLDDVLVLRRFLLITVRLVFERTVRIIVQSIEQSRCDLMLRANINMIATLSNIEYDGFASLSNAFVQNETVRALLMVCLDHKLSSVRALALRALATICCSHEAIEQFGACGGIEILRDILHVQPRRRDNEAAHTKRSDTERREGVSLLTQITAAWHGPNHRVDGLKDCAETIVEGLTDLVKRTQCSQTLLLCVAALNNLSRIEVTSHYSIMSNEAIFKLIETIERWHEEVTGFHYEQIVSMLYNMSLNKKCHSHLANGSIINFITSAYQMEFYKCYSSRAECDAQRRTIKAILHTLTRLVHDTSLGIELLEQKRIPDFFKMAIAGGNNGNVAGGVYDGEFPIPMDSQHSRDINVLTRQLLLAKEQESNASGMQQSIAMGDCSSAALATNARHEVNTSASDPLKTQSSLSSSSSLENGRTSTTSGLKLNLARQESYV